MTVNIYDIGKEFNITITYNDQVVYSYVGLINIVMNARKIYFYNPNFTILIAIGGIIIGYLESYNQVKHIEFKKGKIIREKQRI